MQAVYNLLISAFLYNNNLFWQYWEKFYYLPESVFATMQINSDNDTVS